MPWQMAEKSNQNTKTRNRHHLSKAEPAQSCQAQEIRARFRISQVQVRHFLNSGGLILVAQGTSGQQEASCVPRCPEADNLPVAERSE